MSEYFKLKTRYMRSIFFSILCLFTLSVMAQDKQIDLSAWGLPSFPLDEETQLISFSDVVDVEGVSAADLYQLGLNWIGDYYKNSSSVMQVKDADNGILEGKHSFYVMRDVNGQMVKGDLIKYQFNIRFRDGRYKYTITRINVQKSAYYGIEEWINDENKISDPEIQDFLEQIHTFFTEEYIPAMTEGIQPKKEAKEEDW
ncbi:MAG TPA: hypothetical protein DCG24_09455 [Bacteroidetes bacterium]|nr:hypothetical protein [Bacteroidota bacterium]